ncbi:MAG TPA: PT domain-containing protein [Candidatus Limnocylindrales bacterium]|jgi:hypothetical protein
MDRRSPRASLLLALVAVSAILLTTWAGFGGIVPTGAAPGGPQSSMAGSTSLQAVGPTAIPGTSVWNDDLVASAGETGTSSTNKGPRSTSKPGKTPGPTAGPTTNPTAVPTGAPTGVPTVAPTALPTVKPTAAPTFNPTAAPTANPAPCPMFPSTNVWNKRIDSLPVRSDSATMIGAIGSGSVLHPDFSSLAWNGGLGYGIPYNKVNLSTPTYHVTFDYADESDPGPYPIPSSPRIEGGSDAHLLLWDTEGCNLYEIFAASKSSGQWSGGSGALWDLRSNALRPDGWTSADAAGLPILPGLVRYDEVAAGAILHALRFTAPRTCSNHIYPARHDAGSYSCSSYPPMGLRVRLRASVDISGFPAQAQVILVALKRYGMLLADNGSPWYVTGAPNAGWNDDALHTLQQLQGSDFEAVDTTGLR